MDLKGFLPGKEKEKKKELYWALIIESDWVQAGIWTINENKAQIISFSQPTSWALEGELIQAVDTVLSTAIQNFPENETEPSKTVFGVVASWVSEGQIKKEYLDKLKQICSKLSLEPVGFVVLPEAISNLVKVEEGAPLSSVVLGLSKEKIEISIFSLGNLRGTSYVARSVSVVEDVAEGLSRFSGSGSLPSRFILYNGREGELDEVRQILIKGNWDDFEKIKFLHTPKIEIIEPERKIIAVALAGASEIAGVSEIDKKSIKEETFDEKSIPSRPLNLKPASEKISAEDLGFVMEKDVRGETGEKTKDEKLDDSQKLLKEETGKSSKEEVKKPEEDLKANTLREIGQSRPLAKFRNIFMSFLGIFSNIFLKLKPGFATGRRSLFIGVMFFLIIIFGLFGFWWFYPRATITLYISAQTLNETVEVNIDPNLSQPNYSESALPGELVETSLDGEKTKSTTGTKTVGEKAKGTVTFYRVGPELTLNSDTLLTGANNLKFSLDETITLASGSASSPGTTSAQVTAYDIGAQYNLASQTSFTVANYSTSDIEAKNSDSFSGGSSREISAVSEEDQETLEKELRDELLEKAKEELKKDISDDLIFIDESVSSKSTSLDFSDKVGDEASTLKLNLSLDVSGIAVEKKSAIEVARESLKDKVPEGYVLRDEQIDINFEFIESKDEVYKLETEVSANLLPEINVEEISEKVKGKYPEIARKYLTQEVAGFTHADVILKPKLPGRLGTLPHISKNIEIEITAER
ncbi:hypothetical protein A2Z22_02395 [Candidatus Woesebacteria bacterium RBG_16_34_12]|uniref:Uncharacterized protein n=1 Tax=Candidatus Woesebacteria bacterium RBG_16_34_12 TaxID=1802480 RepID=A0A1F7X9D8_9BACT|nr:MAG: hypothetical protein A2Z22_02395 [Candidatus Woesebacteria bacterium RBG_16_34_12]